METFSYISEWGQFWYRQSAGGCLEEVIVRAQMEKSDDQSCKQSDVLLWLSREEELGCGSWQLQLAARGIHPPSYTSLCHWLSFHPSHKLGSSRSNKVVSPPV